MRIVVVRRRAAFDWEDLYDVEGRVRDGEREAKQTNIQIRSNGCAAEQNEAPNGREIHLNSPYASLPGGRTRKTEVWPEASGPAAVADVVFSRLTFECEEPREKERARLRDKERRSDPSAARQDPVFRISRARRVDLPSRRRRRRIGLCLSQLAETPWTMKTR